MQETPDIVYGRLLESAHISGYSFERVCDELNWLLEENRWKQIGAGHQDFNAFLSTVDLSAFNMSADQRRPLVRKMRDLEASYRSIAKAVGVDGATIHRDVNPSVANATKPLSLTSQNQKDTDVSVANATPAPFQVPPGDIADHARNTVKAKENLEKRATRLLDETKDTLLEPACIVVSDCLSVLTYIQPIDLLIADPPYFTDGNFTPHISASLAKVKTSGQAYVFLSADPEEVSAYLMMNTHHMVLTQLLVWNYNNTGQKQPAVRYNSNYQLILYYRGPDAPEINRPGDGTHQYACQTINAPDGRIGDRFHEWQKPLELIERLIRNSSVPGSLVFDPFAGTGTTLLAASRLGRKSIGCDIDPDAVDICTQRGCQRDF